MNGNDENKNGQIYAGLIMPPVVIRRYQRNQNTCDRDIKKHIFYCNLKWTIWLIHLCKSNKIHGYIYHMKKVISLTCMIILFLLVSVLSIAQNTKEINILAGQPDKQISPNMWGIFFEDINFAADGGIYAELVKNRSFEFTNPTMAWKEIEKGGAIGTILVQNRGALFQENPRYASVTVKPSAGTYILSNEGFRGMGIKANNQYEFSVLAKRTSGDLEFSIQVVSEKGEVIGAAKVNGFNQDWNKLTASFTSANTDPKAHLELVFKGSGTLDMDMVSLFPKETWRGRPGGLRKDLVQLLADLKPGFVRFPGGCIVEGKDLVNRYQWKNTVGPIEKRKLIMNRWNVEFKAPRDAPDYFQSYGLGFFEYFQLAEDLGSEPLPILNCGMACQFNSSEVVAMDQLDPYIQDALDLIEFANGSVNTKWGALRAEMGHPAPFNLKMMGVGNEQWDPQYVERYKAFAKVLKAKYPEVKLVTSSGPFSDGEMFNYLSAEMKSLHADIVDEHYYRSPEWFFQNSSRYDNYDRNGPQIFAGEYAAHSKDGKDPESRNTWYSALSEAAFMTGLERNADMVRMASYAPLLAHVDAWQWRPDLIWFDNLTSIGTPNYHVQKLFSNNKGTYSVPALTNGKVLNGLDSVYASAVVDSGKNELIVKVVNIASVSKNYSLNIQGKKLNGPINCTIISSSEKFVYNDLHAPSKVVPVDKSISASKGKVNLDLQPMSLNVIHIPLKK